MTVQTETSRARYATNGTTGPFSVPFYFLDADHLAVYYTDGDGVETLLTRTTHYSVTGAGDPSGGAVTTVASYASGGFVTIIRAVPATQLVDYSQGDAFPAESHEQALDKITMLVQQQNEKLDRALVFAPSDTGSGQLPEVSIRANRLLAFDSNGVPTASAPASGTAAAVLADLASTSSTSLGAALVGWIRTATSAVATTLWKWLDRQTIDAFDFMTAAEVADVQARTRTLDVTTALQAAIAACGANRKLRLGAGSYRISAALASAAHRFHIEGEGPYATELYVVPTANITVFTLGSGSSQIAQQSLKNLSFYSADSTYEKIALDILDTTGVRVDNVVVGGSVAVSGVSYWSGGAGGSTGIRVRGREAGSLSNLYLVADKPLRIAGNPSSSIDIDHFNFHNLYLIANGYPCVTIDSGVNLYHTSFTGHQAWVKGTYGLDWNDSASSTVSIGLAIENVRTEQGTSSTAYCFRISHNYGLQGVKFRNCYGGSDRKGYYLRKCEGVDLDTVWHIGTTNEALNVDSTVKRISGRNNYWGAGSTASMSGQRLVRGSPLNPNTAPIPSDFYYDESANADRNEIHDGVISCTGIVVANDGVTGIGGTNTTAVVMIATSEGAVAIYALNGGNHSVAEISDPSGVFTAAAGGASSTNIYWSAGNTRYELQNKRGSSVTYRVIPLGSYTS